MVPSERRRTAARAGRLIAILLANVAAALLLWKLAIAPEAGVLAKPVDPNAATPAQAASAATGIANAAVDQRVAQARIRELERRARAIVAHFRQRAVDATQGRLGPCEIAVHVRERGSGASFGIDEDRPLRPASNMKLVTTAAALVLLGPAWSFDTVFESSAPVREGTLDGDLVVRAAGDPLFDPGPKGDGAGGSVARLFEPLLQDLIVRQGLRRVKGHLVLDEGSFEAPVAPRGWPAENQRWAEYCALAGGFSANRGCLTALVTPGAVGAAAQASILPRGHGLPERIEVETAKGGKLLVHFGARADLVSLTGSIPASSSPWSDSCAHPDPVELFGHVLRSALEDGGLVIEGQLQRQRQRPPGTVLAHLRTPLTEYLVPINTHSINEVADSVFLALGHAAEGEGTREAGARATAQALARLGVSTDGFAQVDGSGLSRENRVTARQIGALIEAVLGQSEETARLYLASLAVAGEKGTLDDRMKDSPARGRVQAKTGFIAGTSALSGLARDRAGRELVFSILVNYPELDGLNSSCWKPMQDALCELLVGVEQ
jgi:serine-type D-Ala-D-Ala carboxypeptidase/endopeptidase (penicillin-binding protein 4)